MFAHIPITPSDITKTNILKMNVSQSKSSALYEIEVDVFLLSIGGKIIRGYYHVHDMVTKEVVDQMRIEISLD